MNSMKNKCTIQFSDGKHCKGSVIKKGKCFWHSNIPKTDETIKKYFPKFESLMAMIEESQPNLEKAVLVKADLRNINFSNLNLRAARFDYSNLSSSKFVNADLRSVYFKECILEKSDLSKTDLTKAGIESSNLRHANLDHSILTNARIETCDLSFCSCKSTSFQSTTISFSNLYQADIKSARFSNKEVQLRFCNLNEPNLLSYLRNKIIEWIEFENKLDVLRVIQFLQKQLRTNDFEQLIRNIYTLLGDKYNSAREHFDVKEVANIYEFLARLVKIVDNIPYLFSLPDSSSHIQIQKDEFIRIKALLLDNVISLKNFNKLSSDILNLYEVIQNIALKYGIISKRTIPQITYLSLGSPLEIIIISGAIFSGMAPFILKLFSMYKDIVLKNVQIEKEKTDLKKIKLEREIRLIEYKIKLREGLNITEKESKEVAESINNHVNFILSPIFIDYELSTKDGMEKIKSKTERIEDYQNTKTLKEIED